MLEDMAADQVLSFSKCPAAPADMALADLLPISSPKASMASIKAALDTTGEQFQDVSL